MSNCRINPWYSERCISVSFDHVKLDIIMNFLGYFNYALCAPEGPIGIRHLV